MRVAWQQCRCAPPGLLGLDGFCTRCRPGVDPDPRDHIAWDDGPDDVAPDDDDDEPDDDVLPAWCAGLAYSADRDVATLRIQLLDATGQLATVHLEMTPGNLRALVDALTKCLDRASERARVLDVS